MTEQYRKALTSVSTFESLKAELKNLTVDCNIPTALLEPVIHITAVSKDDMEFKEKYDRDRNIILTIPDGTTEILPIAFSRCTAITEVHFPESLKTIGYAAFSECTGLTEVHLPDSLTNMGGAFMVCTGLTKVHLPESLTIIHACTFRECTGLTELQFPESLTTIYVGAFVWCTGLTKLQFPESLTYIARYAFPSTRCTGLVDIYCPSTKLGVIIGKGKVIYY